MHSKQEIENDNVKDAWIFMFIFYKLINLLVDIYIICRQIKMIS